MARLLRIPGFSPYLIAMLLNAMTDLGHKIIIQNTIFKCYSGDAQIALTALVNGLILLPYIMFFTPSGFISDKYPKNWVMRISAAVTIPATIGIYLCYRAGLFWPAFGLTFLLGIQAAVYSPAKYGYIKELVGKELLAPANAAVQAVTVIAILAGALVYSIFFEHLLGVAGIGGDGMTPGAILMAVTPCALPLIVGAVLETGLTWLMPSKTATDTSLRFDRKTYLKGEYLKSNLRTLTRTETIWLSAVGLAIFWAVNQVLLAAFGAHLKDVAGVENTVVTQGLLALGGVGIIIGSGLAGRVSRNFIETGVIPIGAVGMTAGLFLLPSLSSPFWLGALMLGYGICGGLLIVPLNALIQFHARGEDLGKVLAGNNFIQNLLMLLFLAAETLAATVHLGSRPLFHALAVVALGGTIYTLYKLPQSLLRYILGVLVAKRYNLTVSGLNNIPSQGGTLLLGNHTSYLDWAVLHLAVPRRVRFVMARDIYERWYLKWLLDRFEVIPISPTASKGAIQAVTAALTAGECVAIFPEGAITRNGQLGTFKRGFELAAKGTGCAVVPFYMRGLWGSLFSFATAKLRETSKLRSVRDVTICFGSPLSEDASAAEVKAAVLRLSVTAWHAYATTFDTIPAAWLKAAKRAPNRLAVAESSGVRLTNRRFLAGVLLTAGLLGRRTRGEQNVGVLLPPSAAGIMANMALLLRGKTVVNLNFTSGRELVAKAVARADIRTLVTSRQFLTRLAAKGFDLKELLPEDQIFYMEDLRETVSSRSRLIALAKAWLLPALMLRLLYCKRTSTADTAAILFSSGSEGTPKGVMLSHENIVGNAKQVASLINPRDNDIIVGSLPLFHAFGLTITTLLPLLEGIPVVCHPDPTDAVKIGRLVAQYQATLLCGTPTFLGLYARNRKLNPLMFASLRLVVAGAERLPEAIRTAFKDKFNKEVFEGYGTTETTPVAAVNTPDVLNTSDYTVQQGTKPGTVGLPLPGSFVRVVDPVTFDDLPRGEAGMVVIGGTQIMKGYLDDPEKTASVLFERDGIRWYVTGDKGRLDEDGFLTILDRYSRFAKIGGEMISLSAVEDRLARVLPEGAEACAVAVPDPKKGELVAALVAGMEDPGVLRKSLLDAGVEAIMVPSRFIGVAAIPKLGSGKNDVNAAKKLALANEEGAV